MDWLGDVELGNPIVWFFVGACFVVAGGLWALNWLAARIGEGAAKLTLLLIAVVIIIFSISLATPEELDKMIDPFRYLWGG